DERAAPGNSARAGRPLARAGGDDPQALARGARCAYDRRSGRARLPCDGLVRHLRDGRHAEGRRREGEYRICPGAEVPGRDPATDRHGAPTRGQLLRRVRGERALRDPAMGRGDQEGGHQARVNTGLETRDSRLVWLDNLEALSLAPVSSLQSLVSGLQCQVSEGESMRCYYIDSVNGKTVFEPREAAVPQPRKGELLVRVRAASLNRGELLASIGFHAVHEARPAGGDCAGEVEAV